MIRGLREAGHEVEECGPRVYRRDPGQGGSPGWVGLAKAILPQAAYELAELAYSFHSYRQVCAAITTFRPDAIYERYALYNLGGLWAARRFQLPILLEVNSPVAVERGRLRGFRLRSLGLYCEGWAWRNATCVLPVTGVLSEFVRAQGVPPSRIEVIGNAVNLADYAGLPSPDEAKQTLGLTGKVVIGFTGFVCEWDRLDRILRWLATYQGPEHVHVLVVGDGPVRGTLESQARVLGVGSQLTFTGVLPRAEVPKYAAAFDIALQMALVPYASPLCLFEYLALGKAILAPDQPNHHEVLRPTTDSLLYDPASPSDLEIKLATLVADSALRGRLGAAAKLTVVERGFTWKANGERIARLIERQKSSGHSSL